MAGRGTRTSGLLASLRELEQAGNPEWALDRVRILELANKPYSLYVTQTPQEKTKLLRMVRSNCAADAVRVYPTYRKPFDMIQDANPARVFKIPHHGSRNADCPDVWDRMLSPNPISAISGALDPTGTSLGQWLSGLGHH